jgi:hypothetical protein
VYQSDVIPVSASLPGLRAAVTEPLEVDVNDPERKPLLVSEFEERVVKTDEMEDLPDTAFLGLFGEIGSLVSALKKRR